jgi:hypothetical protein
MGQLQIAIIDDMLTGIPAIRYRDSSGQYPALNLSQRSGSQGNKRARAILQGTLIDTISIAPEQFHAPFTFIARFYGATFALLRTEVNRIHVGLCQRPQDFFAPAPC